MSKLAESLAHRPVRIRSHRTSKLDLEFGHRRRMVDKTVLLCTRLGASLTGGGEFSIRQVHGGHFLENM